MTKWDKRFLDLARVVSTWSKDNRKQVGAVIAKDKHIISVGYNGLPIKITDDERIADKEWKNKRIIHAELNAILNAKQRVDYTTLYCTHMPCSHCASIIIQSGISEVIVPYQYESHMIKWGNDGKDMLREANVDVYIY